MMLTIFYIPGMPFPNHPGPGMQEICLRPAPAVDDHPGPLPGEFDRRRSSDPSVEPVTRMTGSICTKDDKFFPVRVWEKLLLCDENTMQSG
jgi:hypothetical protein